MITKGIAPNKLNDLFDKRRYIKMKYPNMPIPANSGICNDKMAILSWGEKPTGVLVKSKQIVEKQKEFFNSLWNSL